MPIHFERCFASPVNIDLRLERWSCSRSENYPDTGIRRYCNIEYVLYTQKSRSWLLANMRSRHRDKIRTVLANCPGITIIAVTSEPPRGNCGIRRIGGEAGARWSAVRAGAGGGVGCTGGLMHLEWNVSSVEAYGTKATTPAKEKMVLLGSRLWLNLV